MNKRNFCCYISVVSVVNGCNNVTCINTIFIKVAVGWVVSLYMFKILFQKWIKRN